MLLLLASLCAGPARAIWDFRAQEHASFKLLNQARAKKGLPALIYDDTMADVARYHSEDMTRNGFFAHQSPTSGTLEDRLAAAQVWVLSMRENLAKGANVTAAHQALLKAGRYNANIMARDVTHVGVGITRGGKNGAVLLVTQVFGRPYAPEPAKEARERILYAIYAARKKTGLPPLEPDERLDDLAWAATKPFSSLPTNDDVKAAGRAVSERLKRNPIEDLLGTDLSVQCMVQSKSFRVPTELLEPGSDLYGLSVQQVQDAKGRPVLAVFLLVGAF